jgi:hypothetical protein
MQRPQDTKAVDTVQRNRLCDITGVLGLCTEFMEMMIHPTSQAAEHLLASRA